MPSVPLPRLPDRRADSHKGDYGNGLLIGGSRGMAGAIGLAGQAALRSGAGLITLAVPDVCQATVASFEPSYMTLGLPSDRAGRIAASAQPVIQQRAQGVTCLGCGPGMGRSEDLDELVLWIYETLWQPVVFDADALNALATQPERMARPGGPRILTPHPGEFRRLVGVDGMPIDQCQSRSIQLAADMGIVVVLKGHETLVTDGQIAVQNRTGNPGMATAGAGDVLTGVITALVGQGLTPRDAAHLGVHVHGLAGDLAAGTLGNVSLIASDLVRWLPQAFRAIRDS